MRSNVVPLHGRLATAEKLEESIPVTSPLGAPGPALAVAPVEPLPPPAAAVADPFAIPPAPAVPGGASPSLAPPMPSHFASQIDVPKKGGVPLWFWPILVLFLGFGVGGGVFLFRQQPPQQIVVQVPAAPTNPAPTAPRDDTPPPSSAAEPAASVPSASVKVAANGPKNTGATPPPATTDKKGGSAADLSGLLPGAGGPSVGPGGGPGGGGGGGLDQAAVQRVVRERSPGVKRTCWERGGGDQKSSANINVSITVAPNGSVSGATASGDDPVIAKCIEGQVRGWSFPAPGSTSTVNIPFHFVRQ